MVRKTRRQREEEKRKKRVRIWMSIFIIAIMVLSVFGFVLVFYAPQSQQRQQQGAAPTAGMDYELRGDRIYVEAGGQEIPFYTFPDPAIVVPEQAVSLLENAQTAIVAFDPTDGQNARYVEQVRFDLSQYLPAARGAALLAPSDRYEYPVSNCSAATPQAPYVKVVNGSVGVSVEGSCVTLSGSQTELLRARDQLLYAYYDLK